MLCNEWSIEELIKLYELIVVLTVSHHLVLEARDVAELIKKNMVEYGLPLPVDREKVFGLVRSLGLPSRGEYFFYTGGLYQLAPYIRSMVVQLEKLEKSAVVGIAFKLAKKAMRIVDLTKIAVKPDKNLEKYIYEVLKSISDLLRAAGVSVYYDPEADEYSGALLYDLGLVRSAKSHGEKIMRKLSERGVTKIITIDPHTTHMIRTVYRDLLGETGIEVRTYIEVLAENIDRLNFISAEPISVVIHDPCIYARFEDVIEQPRRLLEAAGYKVLEPKRSRQLTYCCGGPIESLAPDLSKRIAENRVNELSSYAKLVVTLCPICFLNLSAVSKPGVRVEDISILLARRLARK